MIQHNVGIPHGMRVAERHRLRSKSSDSPNPVIVGNQRLGARLLLKPDSSEFQLICSSRRSTGFGEFGDFAKQEDDKRFTITLLKRSHS